MSSNTPPSGFRNFFGRRRGRGPEQNSISESDPSLRPNSSSATRYALNTSSTPSQRPVFNLTHHVRLTSPGLRERFLDTLRAQSRKQSALRTENRSPTPASEMATLTDVDVTLRQSAISPGT